MIDSTLIEKYFSGSLSDDEHLEFETLYKNNSEFKQEVDLLKNIKTVSEREDAEQFKATLQGFEFDISKKHSPNFFKLLKPFAAIAAILLIAFCFYFVFNSSINERQLFADYFEPSKNVSIPILRSGKDLNTTTNAFLVYSEKDYEKASVLFEKAYDLTKNSELLFYEGNALLALGKTNEAITKFKEHLTFSDILSNRSHWYLALAYLQNKNLELAKKELKVYINSSETFKAEEAKSLLEKLE